MSDQIQGSTSFVPQPPDAQFAEMMEHAQAGDREAIVSFLRYYEGPIYGYIRKQVGNDEDAKDLYNEAVLKICKALPNTDEGLRLPAVAKKWFFKIVTHLIFDYFEAFKRLPTVSLENLEQRFRAGDMNAVKDWHTVEQLNTPGVEDTVCSKEDISTQQGIVSVALGQVPGQLRKCFYMKDVQGLSHQEIARALRISESTARAYASRGRQAFIKAVAQLKTQQEGRM